MPRKSAITSLADEQAAPGGAAAVDRALSLLSAFKTGDTSLSVTELAERTRLYKSTVLRLLASLYTASFSLQDQVLPVMQDLVNRTGESVALHVRQGQQRLCLFRVDSPQLLRDHVRAGDLLPLDRGAGGRVLMAFGGAKGKLYERIRQDGYVHVVGDRIPGLVGVSAPVWKAGQELVGALTLTVPETRFKTTFIRELRSAAERISQQLN